MVKGKVSFVVENSSIVKGGAIVELVKGNDIIRIRIGQSKMSYKPTSTVAVSRMTLSSGHENPDINPAPPVIIIFFTSGSGSNFVLPFSTGASFQTPKSSKNFVVPLEAGI